MLRRWRHRFIPARAGNTGSSSGANSFHAVHPRTRGEHLHAEHQRRSGCGSSPHARGTPIQDMALWPAWRFIPARAGNTTLQKTSALQPAVHPRTRGEHGVKHDAREIDQRFIPARAGNTTRARGASSRHTVHPRTRGEHHFRDFMRTTFLGSSPHARGTRVIGDDSDLELRFIPARAGNTGAR